MTLRRNERTAYKRVADEVLVIASDTNTLTVLNDTAGRLWELLAEPSSVDELTRRLSEEYEVDGEQARRDVLSFVESLREKGLLVETSS